MVKIVMHGVSRKGFSPMKNKKSSKISNLRRVYDGIPIDILCISADLHHKTDVDDLIELLKNHRELFKEQEEKK